ncbi:MAG: glycosyltransferase [Roseibium sp.]|nr:glycosyltransferase [Roseibium sp.]
MISVIIPTENSEARLVHTLAALVPAAAEGMVREVVVVDGGSTDNTATVAEAAGCEWLVARKPRSDRLARGAGHSQRGDWLLFLQPETLLETGWHHEAQTAIERAQRAGSADRMAFSFPLKFDAFGPGARFAELSATLRSYGLGMPYANQGLLLSRRFYAELGGHHPLPEMEDLDLVKRIGRRRLFFLRAAAVCPTPVTGEGRVTALRRAIARFCVGTLRVPPRLLLRLHG